MNTVNKDIRRLFLKKGTCSALYYCILNREFGHTKETEEKAADPLCGGLLMTGHQCGMLWGATLGVGAESFRRHGNNGRAIATAITATRHISDSFSKRAKSVDCRDVTGCDLTKKSGMMKLMVKTILSGFIYSRCFNLAKKWAPEAINAAKEGLSHSLTGLKEQPVSCATEVARKMGASNEEMICVAGFAGGMGLSGNACGALSAAIWMNNLAWSRKKTEKTDFKFPNAVKIANAFYKETGNAILCNEITGEHFNSMDDHSRFIKKGGCAKLIDLLAKQGSEMKISSNRQEG